MPRDRRSCIKAVFHDLPTDEEGHTDFPDTQLDLHDRVGARNNAQLNAPKMDNTK